MNKLQEWKLQNFMQKFGRLTIDECLELAIQCESYAIPGDIAYAKFAYDKQCLFEYAQLLELNRSF